MNTKTIRDIKVLKKFIQAGGACNGIPCSRCLQAFFGTEEGIEQEYREKILNHQEQLTTCKNPVREKHARRRLLEILKGQHTDNG